NQVENLFALRGGDPRVGKILELVGMQMQAFASQKGGLRHRIGGAVREHQLGLDKTAHRVTDEIEQRQQFAARDFWRFGSTAASPCSLPCARRHQDLVQRAAAASSWSRASIQLLPLAPSSLFQNGALALR